MYNIDNMTLKDYIKDRTSRYFNPLNSLLCCIKSKEEKTCDCPINVFSNSVVETLRKKTLNLNIGGHYHNMFVPKIETVSIISQYNIKIIRRKYV